MGEEEGSIVMKAKNELRAEVEIDADPGTVWSVLMDFGAYPEWNPFIDPIAGDHAVGARLRLRIQPPDSRGTRLTPRVTVFEPGRVFGWLGSLGVPRIFDGAHRFELEPLDGGRRTRFVQSERFRGILLPFVRRSVLPATLRGFQAMNRALADRVVTMKASVA
jgi:hypothetical protein